MFCCFDLRNSLLLDLAHSFVAKIRVYGADNTLIGYAFMASTFDRSELARQQYEDALGLVKNGMEFGEPEYLDAWWAKFVISLVRSCEYRWIGVELIDVTE